MIMEKQSYLLGTALKFSIVISVENPDSVSVMIQDDADTVVKAYSSATKVTNKIYEFVYQSSDTGSEGEYTAVIKVVNGIYTSLDKVEFKLLQP
jgi:hypothetical protein